MNLFYVILAVIILAYVLAVAWAGKYSWRWGCAAAVLLLNVALTVGLFGVLRAFASWGDGSTTGNVSAQCFISPTGYLLLLTLAVVVRPVVVADVLVVAAHVVLFAGVQFWGPEAGLWLAAFIFAAVFAPIWLLAHHAKPRKAAGANVAA